MLQFKIERIVVKKLVFFFVGILSIPSLDGAGKFPETPARGWGMRSVQVQLAQASSRIPAWPGSAPIAPATENFATRKNAYEKGYGWMGGQGGTRYTNLTSVMVNLINGRADLLIQVLESTEITNAEKLELITARGYDMGYGSHNTRKTVLHLAASMESTKIAMVAQILKTLQDISTADADIVHDFVNAQDEQGNTALHLAIKWWSRNVPNHFDAVGFIEMLRGYGARIDIGNEAEQLPADVLYTSEQYKFISRLCVAIDAPMSPGASAAAGSTMGESAPDIAMGMDDGSKPASE